MTHKYRHKQLQRIKQKYKNLAAIVAAATILSTAMLPGIPTATAHASASSNGANLSATTSQGIGKTSESATQINFNTSVSPTKESKVQQQNPKVTKISETIPKPTEKVESQNKTPEPSPITNETPEAIPEPTEKIESQNKIPEPSPIINEIPEAIPEPTEKVESQNKIPEPSPIINETPEAIPKPAEEVKPIPPPETPAPTSKKPSSSTPPSNYKEVLDISATAYAPGPHDNDQWGNKTYIGSQVRPGIIAVDPTVIPLGSRVYIQYPDGHGEYAIAEDTGGAIKGNRVDVAKWTVNEAQDFGIQKVKVYVVSTPEKV